MVEYTDVANTGIAWLPQIPQHWEVRKLKYAFNERSEKGYPDEPLLVSSQNMGVVPKSVYGKRTVEALKDLDKLKLVKAGDYVVSLRSFQGGIEYAYYQGIISPAYTIMEPHKDFKSDYYKFLFKSAPFIKLLTTCVTGIREGQNVDYKKLRNVEIPVPPRAEQDQIVRFLDWKVSEINKLIRIRRKEIQELEEYRAVKLTSITHYGLDKNRTLKDTGYSWIGAIPADWHVRAFSKVASVKSNIVQPESYMEEMQVSPASIEKNTGKIIQTQTVKESGIISGNHRFYQGQILYSKVRPLLNKVAIASFDGLCSADMYPIETALDTKYFLYFMLSQNFLGQLSMSGNRVKMPKINQDELSSVLILFPDIKEQKLIAKKLDQLFALVDGQIERIKQNTSLLQELKSVVISDVVTGKIDVRNVTVPEYEHVDDFVDDDCENHEETEETETDGEEA